MSKFKDFLNEICEKKNCSIDDLTVGDVADYADEYISKQKLDSEVKEYMESLDIEPLAAIEHERWSDWQRYLHSKLAHATNNGIKIVVMAKSDYDRWERQIYTEYSKLSEKEKQSYRDEVMRYLPVLARQFYLHERRAVLEAEETERRKNG